MTLPHLIFPHMPPLNLKESDRQLILRAMRKRQVSKLQLAEALGVGPAWITKLFNGTLKTLTAERRQLLEKFLGITFSKLVPTAPSLPTWLVDFHAASQNAPELQTIAHSLLELVDHPAVYGELRWFTTSELEKIGAEATRIVTRWDQSADPHYTRIGREIVEFISALAGSIPTDHRKVAESGPPYSSRRPTDPPGSPPSAAPPPLD